MDYSNPIYSTYFVQAATISTAAEVMNITGPSGKQGRLIDVTFTTTLGVTVAADLLSVGTAADADAYGTLVVPIQAIDAVTNGVTDLTSDSNLITADTQVVVSAAGTSTAGAGSIAVTIAWF